MSAFLLGCFVNGQAHGMLFKPHRIACILGIHAVHDVVLCVHVDAAVCHVHAASALVQLACRMDEPEEVEEPKEPVDPHKQFKEEMKFYLKKTKLRKRKGEEFQER